MAFVYKTVMYNCNNFSNITLSKDAFCFSRKPELMSI